MGKKIPKQDHSFCSFLSSLPLNQTHERLLTFPRISSNRLSCPTWLTSPGHVLLQSSTPNQTHRRICGFWTRILKLLTLTRKVNIHHLDGRKALSSTKRLQLQKKLHASPRSQHQELHWPGEASTCHASGEATYSDSPAATHSSWVLFRKPWIRPCQTEPGRLLLTIFWPLRPSIRIRKEQNKLDLQIISVSFIILRRGEFGE